MQALHDWMAKQFADHLVEPNSGLGQAITYLQQREAELTNQISQTEAELAAAMDGLRDARHEAEELRSQLERARG